MSKSYYYFKQILFYVFLVAYILLMAKLLLFKEVSLFGLFDANRTISRTVNLIPFKTMIAYTDFNVWIALMNVVGNIVLLIPLGLYLQILKKNKKLLHCAAILFAVSLCVELVQYCFGIGRADIDDVILNVLGGLLGILIYRGIYLLLKDRGKTKTAVTFLFCLICAGFGVCYLILVYALGFMIKIF